MGHNLSTFKAQETQLDIKLRGISLNCGCMPNIVKKQILLDFPHFFALFSYIRKKLIKESKKIIYIIFAS